MRWVKNGPDIPAKIIQAVEDGKVVFFCGAGISRQAGLPDFRGLVDAVYAKLHRNRGLLSGEEKAFENEDYDQVFALLEMAIKEPGLVRREVAEALDLAADADTETHRSLLKLATDPQGRCRLVTTNYDRCFFHHLDPKIRIDAAPRLSVPKPGRWNSVVHLHGFLGDCGLYKEELVLSSADFGAAYLVDGWATRFLRELFQHFIVLFVGYKADDLVVKYMLQALAAGLAERGEEPRAFALAQIEDNEESTKSSWKAKGIEPILYPKVDSHIALHETLRRWAESASTGLLGRRSIVAEHLRQPPPADHDEVVDQVVWALSDEKGATARYLAEDEGSPSPGHWITVLDEHDLFSLGNVPLVSNVGAVTNFQRLHPVTANLASWLTRHVADATILDWALAKGGSLHTDFRWLIRYALKKDKANPTPDIRRAWSFLARHQPDVGTGGFGDLFSLARRVDSGVWDLQLKSEITAIIEPRLNLKRDRLKDIVRKAGKSEFDSYPLDLDIRFAGGEETPYVLASIDKRPDRDSLLTALLADCTGYLRRAMEAQEFFEQASGDHDWTFISLRSIDPAVGGQHRSTLAKLITLTAACMDSASRASLALARSHVEYWKTINYPVFRRLVCFALTRPNLFTPAVGLAYVLGNDPVLWHYSCRSELRQLLAYIWPVLNRMQSTSLMNRILDGPPAAFYPNLSEEEFASVSTDAISERLSILESSDRPLPARATGLLKRLKQKQEQERSRSPVEKRSIADLSPPEIAEILRDGFPEAGFYSTQWKDVVSNDWPLAVDVLRQLFVIDKWPADVWAHALSHILSLINSGAEGKETAPLLAMVMSAPQEFVVQNLHSFGLLLHFLPKLKDASADDFYWPLWDKAFDAARSETATEVPVVENLTVAMNTPIGGLTDALFQWVGKRPDGDMEERFWERLRLACDATSNWGTAARCYAAMHLVWLFARQPRWVSATLLPSFDWNRPDEAKLVWQGFFYGPAFSETLWTALKKDFLATFENIETLDSEPARLFYQTVGRIVVHEPNWLNNDEGQRIVTYTTPSGREQIAWVLWSNLEAAGDKAAVLWRERIGPWLEECWQPDEALKDEQTSHNLISLALSAGDALPEAVDLIVPRLKTLDRAESAIYAVGRSKAPDQFPSASLRLLDKVINRKHRFYKGELESVLARIAEAWPEAKVDQRFLELSNFAAG
jgi:SIR2-like domain